MWGKFDRESGVSVLVGTLLLIVVVIVGTLTIATILSGVSTQTSKQANPHNQASASAVPIYIAGSDNMQSLNLALGNAFSGINNGIYVQSNIIAPDGIVPALSANTIDIGALSGQMSYLISYKNPNIKSKQIGSSAVVVIVPSSNTSLTSAVFGYPRLQNDFMQTSGAQDPVLIRSDMSGTGDTFYTFLGNSTQYGTEQGDVVMIDDIANSFGSVGYADYGDVKNAISQNVKVTIVSINDGFFTYPTNPSYTNVSSTAKYQYRAQSFNNDGSVMWAGNQTNVTGYNMSLIYPMSYVTTGTPNTADNVFMQWAVSPAAAPLFQEQNQFSIVNF